VTLTPCYRMSPFSDRSAPPPVQQSGHVRRLPARCARGDLVGQTGLVFTLGGPLVTAGGHRPGYGTARGRVAAVRPFRLRRCDPRVRSRRHRDGRPEGPGAGPGARRPRPRAAQGTTRAHRAGRGHHPHGDRGPPSGPPPAGPHRHRPAAGSRRRDDPQRRVGVVPGVDGDRPSGVHLPSPGGLPRCRSPGPAGISPTVPDMVPRVWRPARPAACSPLTAGPGLMGSGRFGGWAVREQRESGATHSRHGIPVRPRRVSRSVTAAP
jgi:hypothetical protein